MATEPDLRPQEAQVLNDFQAKPRLKILPAEDLGLQVADMYLRITSDNHFVFTDKQCSVRKIMRHGLRFANDLSLPFCPRPGFLTKLLQAGIRLPLPGHRMIP